MFEDKKLAVFDLNNTLGVFDVDWPAAKKELQDHVDISCNQALRLPNAWFKQTIGLIEEEIKNWTDEEILLYDHLWEPNQQLKKEPCHNLCIR